MNILSKIGIIGGLIRKVGGARIISAASDRDSVAAELVDGTAKRLDVVRLSPLAFNH